MGQVPWDWDQILVASECRSWTRNCCPARNRCWRPWSDHWASDDWAPDWANACATSTGSSAPGSGDCAGLDCHWDSGRGCCWWFGYSRGTRPHRRATRTAWTWPPPTWTARPTRRPARWTAKSPLPVGSWTRRVASEVLPAPESMCFTFTVSLFQNA